MCFGSYIYFTFCFLICFVFYLLSFVFCWLSVLLQSASNMSEAEQLEFINSISSKAI